MVENSHVSPMKFLIRGSYCLALTIPLFGGTASSEIQRNNINVDKLFSEDGFEIADSKKKGKSRENKPDEKLVFISDVIVQVLENHPDELGKTSNVQATMTNYFWGVHSKSKKLQRLKECNNNKR